MFVFLGFVAGALSGFEFICWGCYSSCASLVLVDRGSNFELTILALCIEVCYGLGLVEPSLELFHT